MTPIEDADDPRVASFTNLRAIAKNDHAATAFVAEGRWVTQRLLESAHAVTSVLVTEGNESEWQKIIESCRQPESRPQLLVASKDVVKRIVGYDFHRGVIACGTRPIIESIETMDVQHGGRPCLDIYLDGISDAENVGNILRTSAALGIDRVILGPGTVDPYRRRVIRVSMASVFTQSFFHAEDPAIAVSRLVQRGHRVVAATLSDSAQDLRNFRGDARPIVLMLGNESSGIAADVQALANDCIRIPMANNVDSLNVASAAAIFLWRLKSSSFPGSP